MTLLSDVDSASFGEFHNDFLLTFEFFESFNRDNTASFLFFSDHDDYFILTLKLIQAISLEFFFACLCLAIS